MTLSDYIKRLQALEETHGHLPVVMTQSGYYSDGQFADLFEFPEIKRAEVSCDSEYIVLGHSHQSHYH
jgi:hypothetical protein